MAAHFWTARYLRRSFAQQDIWRHWSVLREFWYPDLDSKLAAQFCAVKLGGSEVSRETSDKNICLLVDVIAELTIAHSFMQFVMLNEFVILNGI